MLGLMVPRTCSWMFLGHETAHATSPIEFGQNHDRRDLVSEQQSSRADRRAADATCANLRADPEYTGAKKGGNHGECIVFAVPAVEAPIISYLTRGGQATLDAFATNAELAYRDQVRRQCPMWLEAVLAGASAQSRMTTNSADFSRRTSCYHFSNTAARCNEKIPRSSLKPNKRTKRAVVHAFESVIIRGAR